MAEKELGDRTSVCLEPGLFVVTNKKAGIAGAHARAHGYTFNMEKVRGIERQVVEGEDKSC